MPGPDTEKSKRMTLAWIEVERPVYAYLSSMVADYAAVEDLHQAVAVAMVESFEDYDPSRPLIGWVLGIARHKVLNHYRAQARDRHVFNESVMEMIEQSYMRVESESADLRAALNSCLKSLIGRQREALQMRYREGKLPATIADEMGIAPNAVSNLLSRARASMRQCIQKRIEGVDMETQP